MCLFCWRLIMFSKYYRRSFRIINLVLGLYYLLMNLLFLYDCWMLPMVVCDWFNILAILEWLSMCTLARYKISSLSAIVKQQFIFYMSVLELFGAAYFLLDNSDSTGWLDWFSDTSLLHMMASYLSFTNYLWSLKFSICMSYSAKTSWIYGIYLIPMDIWQRIY